MAFFACTASLGSDSLGQSGKLTFAYQSSQCGFGCALDLPVVEGSLITVQARGGDVNKSYVMRVDPAELASLTYRESCTCDPPSRSTGSYSVDASVSCKSGENKSCTRSADLETHASGTATLKVSDGAGNLVDSIALTIAKADRIDTTVNLNDKPATAGAGGVFAVSVGDKIAIHSSVLSGGRTMVFTRHGLSQTYSDPKVIGTDASVILGATDTENAVATAPGAATVTMAAHGAQAVVRFRVAAR